MTTRRSLIITLLVLVALLLTTGLVFAIGEVDQGSDSTAEGDFSTTLWTRQFGSSRSEVARGIAVDASGAYVGGKTEGALAGQASLGNGDAFVRKYDPEGKELWTRQFGSPGYDIAWGITVDASGVYAAGMTDGALPGQSSLGSNDAFVRKYDLEARSSGPGSLVPLRRMTPSNDTRF